MSQKLTFTTGDMLNTVVSNATDAIYYDVRTPEWEPTLTTVRKLDPYTGLYEHTGIIQREREKPVTVSLYGGASEPVERWVKAIDGNMPEESRWQFDDGEGNVFSWSLENKQWELYSAEEGTKNRRRLATFHQHKRYLYVGMISQPAFLEVDNSVVDSMDAIILSLLIVERKRRGGSLF